MSEIILYRSGDGAAKIEVTFEGDTFWLSQKQLAELFGVEVPTINYHLREILSLQSSWRKQLLEVFE